MKNTIIGLLVLISSFLFHVKANSTDSIFVLANSAYAGEDFEEAINLYESIYALNYESFELYFNLGNAYFKERNYPKAIVNYERALLLDPHNENALYNLDKVRLYTVDKIEVIPEFVIKRIAISLFGLFSSNLWAIFSLSTFLISIILLFIYFLSNRITLRRSGFFGAILFLFLAVFSFYFSYQAKELRLNSKGAIVLSSTVTVKSSPNERSTDLFLIHEGTKVYTVDKLDSWYEIKLSDGKQGWLLVSDVELI